MRHSARAGSPDLASPDGTRRGAWGGAAAGASIGILFLPLLISTALAEAAGPATALIGESADAACRAAGAWLVSKQPE